MPGLVRNSIVDIRKEDAPVVELLDPQRCTKSANSKQGFERFEHPPMADVKSPVTVTVPHFPKVGTARQKE